MQRDHQHRHRRPVQPGSIIYMVTGADSGSETLARPQRSLLIQHHPLRPRLLLCLRPSADEAPLSGAEHERHQCIMQTERHPSSPSSRARSGDHPTCTTRFSSRSQASSAGIHHHRHPLVDIHISNKSAVRNLNGEAAFVVQSVHHAETERHPSSSPCSQARSGDHPTRATRFCSSSQASSTGISVDCTKVRASSIASSSWAI
jgi:hypothetical protein